MIENINKTELKKRVSSYRDGLHENETTSCMIPLADIEALAKHYSSEQILKGQNKIAGFRIYFQRPNPKEEAGMPGRSIYPVDGGKGQLSIILVPTNNYHEIVNGIDRRGADDDMFIENGECRVFIPGGEHTGLCPKNCPQ